MSTTLITIRTPKAHDAAALQTLLADHLLKTFNPEEIMVVRNTQNEFEEERKDRELRREIVAQQHGPNVTHAQLQSLYNWVKTGSFKGTEDAE